MTEEKKIEYLWNSAGALTPLNHTKKLLKSYYLTISRTVARYKFILPKEKFADTEMCEKCSSCWFDGNFSMKLISAKIRSSKANRLVEDLESGKNLTKKQKNRAKWYRKNIFSFLQFTCKLCDHKTNVRLLKPAKDGDKVNVIQEDIIQPQKQKKRKKDKFAGLKIKQLLNKSKIIKNKIKPIKSNTDSINSDIQSTSTNVPIQIDTIKPNNKSIKINTVSALQRKHLKKVQPKSLNINKSKNKNSKMKNTHVVSKTQQKNTILQLAQMLKHSSNSSNQSQNNNTDNRLKNLLR